MPHLWCLTLQGTAAYGDAGQVAEETLLSIKTVVALGAEDLAAKSYEAKLLAAEKTGVRGGSVAAVGECAL